MTDFRFTKEQHLRTGAEFDRVYQCDLWQADQCLVMRAVTNNLGITRLGLSVSKKVGNAVMRNAWKRRIREAFRLSQHSLPSGWDLVIRPKAGAKPDFEQIRRSLPALAQRIARRAGRSPS